VRIAEGTRLFALAGRPTKAQFIKVYGPQGPKMTLLDLTFGFELRDVTWALWYDASWPMVPTKRHSGVARVTSQIAQSDCHIQLPPIILVLPAG